MTLASIRTLQRRDPGPPFNRQSKTYAELSEVPKIRMGRSMKQIVGLLAMVITLAAWGVMAEAQQPQKIYKIGRLSSGSPSDPLSKASYDAFREGMRDLGWIEQ